MAAVNPSFTERYDGSGPAYLQGGLYVRPLCAAAICRTSSHGHYHEGTDLAGVWPVPTHAMLPSGCPTSGQEPKNTGAESSACQVRLRRRKV